MTFGTISLFPPILVIAYILGITPAALSFVAVQIMSRYGQLRYLASVPAGALPSGFLASPFPLRGPASDEPVVMIYFGYVGGLTAFFCTFLAPRWRDGEWGLVGVGFVVWCAGVAPLAIAIWAA